MVTLLTRKKCLLGLLFAAGSAHPAPPAPVHAPDPAGPAFRMECAPSEIFEGEQSFCSFRLFSPHEIVDVEVQKFPEFRGFWKENLSLRQGPLTAQLRARAELYSFLIGTYVVMPMVGNPNRAMEPMKIILKEIGGATSPSFSSPQPRTSAVPDLKILPLPPLPAHEQKAHFVGAVGQFTLAVASNPVSFTPGEPFTVRFQLQGRGNAPEVDTLPWALPETVEVISKRTEFQGSFQAFVKIFEYTLRRTEPAAGELPALQFIYFDPSTRQYVHQDTPAIQLIPTAVAAARTVEDSPLPLAELKTTWTATPSLLRNPLFWALQGMLGILCIAWAVVIFLKARRSRRASHCDPEWKEKKVAALHALRHQKNREFLKEAAAYIHLSLVCDLNLSPQAPRTEILTKAKAVLPDDLWHGIQTLFRTQEAIEFSPSASVPASLENFLSTFLAFSEKTGR